MSGKSFHIPGWLGISAFGVLVAASVLIFLDERHNYALLQEKADAMAGEINDMQATVASSTSDLKAALVVTQNILSGQMQSVGALQNQLGNFQQQVGSITGTVDTLQKLSQTDPQLLEKYSKVYFLNENYVPAHLSEIPLSYQYSSSKQLLIHTSVLPHLETMLDAASSSGVKLFVDSAYRSFAEQKALKGQYTMTYGAGTANSFSADQGYSEHQLGTTVDLITTGLSGQLDGFDKTAAYQWMLDNGYKYGFVLSYPKNNGYYVFEPWHWRFVGIRLANDLHNQGKNFYDLDQRTIDTYLVSMFP